MRSAERCLSTLPVWVCSVLPVSLDFAEVWVCYPICPGPLVRNGCRSGTLCSFLFKKRSRIAFLENEYTQETVRSTCVQVQSCAKTLHSRLEKPVVESWSVVYGGRLFLGLDIFKVVFVTGTYYR